MERLICRESDKYNVCCQSLSDPVFTDDDRVLQNLLYTQHHYVIKTSYFKTVQDGLKIWMREKVARWMIDVCEEERCESDVFPLSMNIMDRFLSLVKIFPSQLQLLSSVCIFLAAKLRQSKSIYAESLIRYSDYSFTKDQLESWELLVLSHLGWDLAAVTPNDFLNLILRRLPTRGKSKIKLTTIKRHAQIFITICATDFRFSMLPPSFIAASCIAAAMLGLTRLRSQGSTKELIVQMCKMVSIDMNELLELRQKLEDLVSQDSQEQKCSKK
ncbi:G1/S-specific cyclin-D2-like [Brevipalpus obovatus]|uniref:G1/S-specific cyclin-D2-like n=1 Tax=Brevipalpus obovatus TaxID=246614 RepID=UPI003D9E13DE